MRFKGGCLVALVGLFLCGCSSDGSANSAPSLLRQPTTWAEVDDALDELATSTSMIAAEVGEDGSLTPVHERDPDSGGAIGTSFSIYVLGIVTDQIASGDLSWDDKLTITAADKSLPPSQLRDRLDGSAVTVREAAQLMMAESDNTAIDLLIDAVGGEQVESLLPTMGMGEESQARTLPLLKTRERFILTQGLDTSARAEYIEAGVGARRRLLRRLPADLPTDDPAGVGSPIEIESIGWFATPVELARAQLWIDSQRGLPGQEPLEEVLAANRGVSLAATTWSRYSFATGNEPGVLALAWLLRRADGRRFVVSIIANDPSRAIDATSGHSIAAGVIDLLAAA